MKPGGRAAVVIKNTFLSNSDNASSALRKELLEYCNLHTILDCPQKTFSGAGVNTVVLFFQKGSPTKKIWYYDLDPGRSLGKTNPLNDDDLKEFVELQSTYAASDKSWTIDVRDIDESTCDMSVTNPNAKEAEPLRSPTEIIEDIRSLDSESAQLLETIEELI